jgi:hypothetical protein
MDLTRHHTVCSCTSPDHTLHWDYEPGEEIIDDEGNPSGYKYPDELYCYVNLSWNDSFWKRTWKAVKYIFGRRSRYGHFDCFTVEREEAQKLIEFLSDYAAVR